MRRRQLADILEMLGLLGGAYWFRERLRDVNPVGLVDEFQYSRRLEFDGFPIPPTKLRNIVFFDYSGLVTFLESGKNSALCMKQLLERNGKLLEECGAILDFGCGCGRVTRYLPSLTKKSAIHGCDYNPRLIEWCRKNLPFAAFTVNQMNPPTAYQESQFDFIIALSVFTHLPEQLQHAWMGEFRRILTPGGLLYLTTHGERWLAGRLNQEELERFRSGMLVVKRARWSGTNLCTTFHPEKYVRESLSKGFRVKDFVSGGPSDHDQEHQDCYLLQRD